MNALCLPSALRLTPLALSLFAAAAAVAVTSTTTAVAATGTPTQPARGFDCLIEPRQVVEIRSPVEGVIDKLHAERGGQVRRGQLLAELESSVERAAVQVARQRAVMTGRIESARNRAEFARRKLERNKPMLNGDFVAAGVVDEIETELRLAEAELKDAIESQELARLEQRRAEEQLAQRSIRSPFDAYVVDRLLQPGELAEGGAGRKPLFKLAQIDVLRVEVVVPQQAHGLIRVGGRASVRPEGRDEVLAATVAVVDRLIDAASGTFGVRLELANSRGQVPAGTRCSVEFPGLALRPSRVTPLAPTNDTNGSGGGANNATSAAAAALSAPAAAPKPRPTGPAAATR